MLTVVFRVFSRQLLVLFGASDHTLPYAMAYMNTYILGTVFVVLTLSMNFFITAQGFTKISMLSISLGAICNIVQDPVFIFGLDKGIRGAALATVLSQALSMIWILCFLFGKKTGGADPAAADPAGMEDSDSLSGAGAVSLCHADYGMRAFHLL